VSTTRPNPLGPYATPAELARGRRKVVVGLVVALLAVVLAVVASRTVGDGRLVTVYLVAAALHFGASVAASIRWSRTRAFGRADG
jgi:hypothetical protein